MTLEELKAENARLKAELAYDKRVQLHVDKLAAEFTQSEVERLKAQVERLRKAGDAMASSIQFKEEMEQDYNGPTIVRQCVKDWNAAKEGK